MKKWDVVRVRSGEEKAYLNKGYEPFGVVAENSSYDFYDTSSRRMAT